MCVCVCVCVRESGKHFVILKSTNSIYVFFLYMFRQSSGCTSILLYGHNHSFEGILFYFI